MNSWRGPLITSWALTANGILRPGIAPRQLSEEEPTGIRAGGQTTTAPPADAS